MTLTEKDLQRAREHARDADKIDAEIREGAEGMRRDPKKRRAWMKKWGHMLDKMSS